MSKRQGHVLLTSLGMIALAGAGVGAFFLGGGGQDPQASALADVGAFKVGSAVGEERAGFSGRPKVQVFISADDPTWPTLQACLASAEVQTAVAPFVGVIVDPKADPETEAILRQRGDHTVIARGLSGKLYGSLPATFTCENLTSFLNTLAASLPATPEKSPIYASLMDDQKALDGLIQAGAGEKANRFVELLEEFEGASNVKVLAAKAKLGK